MSTTTKKTFYKKPTAVLLPYKGGLLWYICYGRRKERTAFQAHQKAQAKAAAAAFKVAAPGSVNTTPIVDLMRWAKAQPRYKNALHAGILSVWAGKTVGDLSQHSVDAAIVERQTHLQANGEPIKATTASTEAKWLKAISRCHARENGLPDPAPHTIEKTSPHQNERALTKAEIVRLLWACLGLRWDAAALRMVRHDDAERERLRRLRAPLRRLVLLALYAGTGVETGVALVWTGTPEGADSYVDLATGRLHRLGAQAPQTDNLKGVAVALGKRMMAHVRRWRAHDAADVKHLVHVTAAGKYNRGLAYTYFNEACIDAGLSGVSFAMIVTTYAAMALREGASIRATAISLGLSGDAVNRRYRHFSNTFQAGAERAFQLRPKSIL